MNRSPSISRVNASPGVLYSNSDFVVFVFPFYCGRLHSLVSVTIFTVISQDDINWEGQKENL